MGFSDSDSSNCTTHPNHKQSPGVCSSCLREKLSKLSISPSTLLSNKKTYVVSDSSSFSSTPTASSTGIRKSSGSHHHRRNGSETYVLVGMMLKKSRSVSCAPLSSRSSKLGAANVNNNDEKCKSGVNACGEVDNNNSNKKNGFLKKLIHTTGKKTKGVLMQSKTMRERSSSSTTNINKI